MNKLVIFGTGDFAQLAAYYFTADLGYEVAAFTVDADHVGSGRFEGKPVVDFSVVDKHYSPRDHAMFVAIGYKNVNAVREEKVRQAREKGYSLATYVSPRAVVYPNVKIGSSNCFVMEGNTLQPFAEIGDNVILWSGNHIGHHTVIKDHCFVTSHVVIGGRTTVGTGSFLGINCTVRDHVTVGERTVVGAGAVILSDAPPSSVYPSKPTLPSKLSSHRLKSI